MASRPWVTPADVKAYSDRQGVKGRDEAKLAIDIARAELYIIKYTGNTFEDAAKYPDIPDPVKMAALLLSESYAAGAANLSEGKGEYKSESFDDYSYTMADTAYKIGNLDLGPLLDEFIETGSGKAREITMKMRKL